MANGLQGVLEDVRAAILAAAAPVHIDVQIGPGKAQENAAPPRIVMQAVAERPVFGLPPAAYRQRSNPAVAKWQRRVTVAMEFWGDSSREDPYSSVDGLINAAFAAIDRFARTNVNIDPIDGQYVDTDEGSLGLMAVWRIEFLIPIVYPEHATTTIAQYDNNVGTRRADGSEESAGTYQS